MGLKYRKHRKLSLIPQRWGLTPPHSSAPHPPAGLVPADPFQTMWKEEWKKNQKSRITSGFFSDKAGPGRAGKFHQVSGYQFCHPKPAVGGSQAPQALQGRCRRKQRQGKNWDFTAGAVGCVSDISRKSELFPKYPNKGKLFPIPQWKTGSCTSGPTFSFGTKEKRKEANRTKFTKLCFLLFEIGKGSLGNNDQV